MRAWLSTASQRALGGGASKKSCFCIGFFFGEGVEVRERVLGSTVSGGSDTSGRWGFRE